MKTESPKAEDRPEPRPGSGLLKLLSVIAAAAVAALIVIYPRAVAPDGASVPHGWLVMLMAGMSICWVYGFGFIPRTRWLRAFFSPVLGWLLLFVGAWRVFF